MLSIVSPTNKFQFKIFLNLIRALFPNWNFFDQVAYSFELEFKVPGGVHWEPISFYQPRKAFSLFLSPQSNMALAQVNVIEHFAQDIQTLQLENPLIDSKDVQRLTSYKILKSILEEKLKIFEFDSASIQFKVIARSPHEVLDLYISDIISVGSQ